MSDRLRPRPAKTRKVVIVSAQDYSGWCSNWMNFCIRAISMNKKAMPINRKYSNTFSLLTDFRESSSAALRNSNGATINIMLRNPDTSSVSRSTI